MASEVKKQTMLPKIPHMERAGAPEPRLRPLTPEAVARLKATRAAIVRGRAMRDSSEFIEQARDERSAEV